MRTSENIADLAAALAKAQGQIHGAVKDSANPFFKSKYADLASVWEACRVPLSENGLAVIQLPSTEGNVVKLTTRMVHASGQWVEGDVSATAKDEGPQAIGSTVTYLRRYSLQSITGVAPEDDDGNAGQDQVAHPAAKRNGKKAEADKIAEQHGMTTADKLPAKLVTFDAALSKVPTAADLAAIAKGADWLEKEIIAKRFNANEGETFAEALAERAIELCAEPADFDEADKIIRGMASRMRIHDARATELRVKLADAKETKCGAAA